jgi:hypothetical protein
MALLTNQSAATMALLTNQSAATMALLTNQSAATMALLNSQSAAVAGSLQCWCIYFTTAAAAAANFCSCQVPSWRPSYIKACAVKLLLLLLLLARHTQP